MLNQLDRSSALAREANEPVVHGDHFVSFVWVCTGETDLPRTLARYQLAIETYLPRCELIVVINGLGAAVSRRLSTTLEASGLPATLINLNAVSAESAALKAAFRHLRGDLVVLLPSYAQCDPEGVGEMIQALDSGLDYVASWRMPRTDGRAGRCRSWMYNWIARRLSGVSLHDINAGLRVMRREVIANVRLYGDLHLFLPILAARHGFRVGEVPVGHLEERRVRSGEGAGGYLRRALDLLTLFFLLRFTQRPFRLFGGMGAGMLSVGGLMGIVLVIQRFTGTPVADRPLLILATMLIVLGIQVMSLGLLGELIIYSHAAKLSDSYVEKVFQGGHLEDADHAS